MPAAGASDAGTGVPRDAVQQLRDAMAREHRRLCAYTATLVRRFEGPARADRVSERVDDVLAEAAARVLAGAKSFDPRRSPFQWIVGVVINVLRESRRASGRSPPPVRQTDLGEAAWEAALGTLVDPGSSAAAAAEARGGRLRRALARLPDGEQRLLYLAFDRGLDGPALAREVGAPSAGAARTRLSRAVGALRAAFLGEADAGDGGGEGAGEADGSGEEQRA